MELHPNQPQIRGHYLAFSSSEGLLSLTFFALAGEGSVVSSSFFFALSAVALLAAGFFVFAVAFLRFLSRRRGGFRRIAARWDARTEENVFGIQNIRHFGR